MGRQTDGYKERERQRERQREKDRDRDRHTQTINYIARMLKTEITEGDQLQRFREARDKRLRGEMNRRGHSQVGERKGERE